MANTRTKKKTPAKPPHFADAKDVRGFAHGLSESFLACRELGHNWRSRVVRWNGDRQGYDRTLRCTRCKTLREQVLTSFGAILSSRYVYPNGYQSDGLGRIVGDGRDALRLESLTRNVASE